MDEEMSAVRGPADGARRGVETCHSAGDSPWRPTRERQNQDVPAVSDAGHVSPVRG